MEDYKRGSHTVWDCKYHLVWRRNIGTRFWRGRSVSVAVAIAGDSPQSGDGDLRWVDQPRPCAHADWDSAERIRIQGGAVSEGEEFSPFVKRIRSLAEAVLGPAFVGRGYWVATSGNVTDEVWKRYIEEQKPPSPDDDFDMV